MFYTKFSAEKIAPVAPAVKVLLNLFALGNFTGKDVAELLLISKVVKAHNGVKGIEAIVLGDARAHAQASYAITAYRFANVGFDGFKLFWRHIIFVARKFLMACKHPVVVQQFVIACKSQKQLGKEQGKYQWLKRLGCIHLSERNGKGENPEKGEENAETVKTEGFDDGYTIAEPAFKKRVETLDEAHRNDTRKQGYKKTLPSPDNQ